MVGVGVAAEVNWDLVGCVTLDIFCSDDFSAAPAISDMLLCGIVLVAASISRVPGTGRFSALVGVLPGDGLLALLFPADFFSWTDFVG